MCDRMKKGKRRKDLGDFLCACGCGHTFRATRRDALYASPACRQRVHRGRAAYLLLKDFFVKGIDDESRLRGKGTAHRVRKDP